MHVVQASSSQDSDVPDSIIDQKTSHHADGVYQFLYRIFALPTELRQLVWGFACGGDPKIKLAGPEPNGVISLMLALKDPQLRSQGVMGVWKTFSVEWEGSLDRKAWQMFKKTVIPHLRCLTINFLLTHETVFDRGEEIQKTVGWMWRRGKPGNRARYTWHLEQLHLVGLERHRHHIFGLGAYWHVLEHSPKHWSGHWALERLRKDGVKVTVETKDDDDDPRQTGVRPRSELMAFMSLMERISRVTRP